MDKKVVYIIGGVAGFIGAALAYHYFTNMEGDEEEKYDELYNELNEMGAVKKDASGMVVLEDFLKIFKIVTKHSKKQITKFKANNNTARREHLKNEEEDEYKE